MADPLTQLQQGMNNVSHMLFNFIGQAHRDAPPLPVGDADESTVAPSAEDVHQTTRVRADQLMGGFKNLDTLVRALPDDLGSEEEQLRELDELRAQNEEHQRQLQEEYERAERKLQLAQELFGTLAMAELQKRQARKLQQLQQASQAPAGGT
jgi:hypothetical protein